MKTMMKKVLLLLLTTLLMFGCSSSEQVCQKPASLFDTQTTVVAKLQRQLSMELIGSDKPIMIFAPKGDGSSVNLTNMILKDLQRNLMGKGFTFVSSPEQYEVNLKEIKEQLKYSTQPKEYPAPDKANYMITVNFQKLVMEKGCYHNYRIDLTIHHIPTQKILRVATAKFNTENALN